MEKNTKKSLLFLAAAAVTVLNFQSCGKYEDGPGFSLRTKKARLTGELELVKINGQTPANYYGLSSFDQTWDVEGNGDCKLSASLSYYGQNISYTYDGEWEWEDNKEAISIDLDNSSSDLELEIKRLTNKELTVKDEDNVEWEFEKK